MPNFQQLQKINRIEDDRFLKGNAVFSADINIENQLHAVMLRSSHAHAVIRRINCKKAESMPGVMGVFTDSHLEQDNLRPLPCSAVMDPVSNLIIPPRRALGRDRVRHVGDIIALVVAKTYLMARDAADNIEVDLEPLEAVTNPYEALEENATRIWPEAPGNLAFSFQAGNSEATQISFDNAHHIVKLNLVNNRVCAVPLEPRAGIGEYSPATDRYTLTFTGQGLHNIKAELAHVFGLPLERFHLKAPDVGGGFGLKNFIYPEWVLLLWASKKMGRPIKWVAERGEEFAAAAHGRDMRVSAKLALDENGIFQALDADIISNMGAYLSSVAPNIPTKSAPTAMGGIYRVPNVFMNVRGVFTNTAPVDAYRGAGKPEANFLMERIVDVAARQLKIDPVALRKRNAINTFPYHSALGMTIDGGRFGENIEEAEKRIDRAGFEERRANSENRGKLRGLGFACFLETARSIPEEGAELRFTGTEKIELRVGTESHGQGHETTYAQIAGSFLELPVNTFSYIQADTDETLMGHGHGGARSMHMGGSAIINTMEKVLVKARILAADLLQSTSKKLFYSSGRFICSDTNASVTLFDVARHARESDPKGLGLDTFAKVEDVPFTFPNGCHVAEIEIDPDTGQIDLLRYVSAEDYGTILNPKLTIAQVSGGIVQGIGQALGELAAYDQSSGQLITGSLMDYQLLKADNLPSLEINLEDGLPTAANPLGVKGAGQAGAIAAPQTIINAIMDALSPLGIEHLDMPATSESIWRAIRAAQ